MNYDTVYGSYGSVFHDNNVLLCNTNCDCSQKGRSCVVHKRFFPIVHRLLCNSLRIDTGDLRLLC